MKKSECRIIIGIYGAKSDTEIYIDREKGYSCSFQGVVTLKAWIDSRSNLTPPLCPLPFSKTLFYVYKLIRVQNQPLCM